MSKFKKWLPFELNPKGNSRTKAELCDHVGECYERIDGLIDELGNLEMMLVGAREDKIALMLKHQAEIQKAVEGASRPLPVIIEGAAKVTIGATDE